MTRERSADAAGRREVTTRTRIELAAIELFLDQGFEGTTVDEIAAAAGVSRITVFRYFPSKDDIVFAAEPVYLERLVDLLRQEPPIPLRDVLVRFADYLDHAAADLTHPATIILSTPRLIERFSVIRGRWDLAVARELARRRVEADHEPSFHDRITAASAVTAIFVAFLGWSRMRDETFARLVERAIDDLATGVDDPLELRSGGR